MSYRKPRPIVPYYFIINRGYISATQDFKNDIILVDNYLYPALNIDTTGKGTCPPSLSPPSVAEQSIDVATLTGFTKTYFWGIETGSVPNYLVTRKIPDGVKCINKIRPIDKNGTIFIIDQTKYPGNTPDNISKALIDAAGKNPYTQFGLKNINDPAPYRNTNISSDPQIAAPESAASYNKSTYFIRYTTNSVGGGFYTYDPANPDRPIRLIPADSSGLLSPDDFVKINADPFSWHLIRNTWNIRNRNHPDQCIIMDQINNIYIDRANLFMQVTVIFYAGYAAKILPTVEPFKSLLAGIPIDEIQKETNVFRKGLIGTDIVMPVKPTTSTPSQSPYNSRQTFPATTFTGTITNALDPFLAIFGIQPTSSPVTVTVKDQYTLERAIYVPIFQVIKTLWDECAKFDTSVPPKPLYPVVDNAGVNCESQIPDFAYITSYNQIVYRCYFWALNANNKSIIGQTATAANTNFIQNLKEPGTGVKDFHETMLVDAAAYYKALYDNNYLLSGDQFGKPNNASRPTGKFCVKKSPTTSNSGFMTGGSSIDQTGYVFCEISQSASDVISLVRPPPPDPPSPPPPPIPPGVSPPPQISQLSDKQTFLCENRSTTRLYQYKQPTNTKIPYANPGVAISYTPSMTNLSLSDSNWVWTNSLDGINLKCSQIQNDNGIPPIFCPKGQTCAPPPSESGAIPGADNGDGGGGGGGGGEEGGEEEPPPEEPVPPSASGSNNTGLSIMCSVLSCICFCMAVSGVIVFFFVMNNKTARKSQISKLVKKVGGYFQYIIDDE